MSPATLDHDLLHELERRWRAAGLPVATVLRPGLRDDQMDAITAPLGFRLPIEARTWWGWHDGASARPGFEPESLGPGMPFFPLQNAVEVTLRIREGARMMWRVDEADEGFGPDWKPGWLVLTNPEAPTVIDCSVSPTEPVPVRSFWFQEGYDEEDGVRGIGELVRIWLIAFDRAAWTYHPADGSWDIDRDRLDPEIRRTGLT